jgi:hypothetical protein
MPVPASIAWIPITYPDRPANSVPRDAQHVLEVLLVSLASLVTYFKLELAPTATLSLMDARYAHRLLSALNALKDISFQGRAAHRAAY